MEHPGFFERAGPFPLRAIAEATGAELAAGADPEIQVSDVKVLSDAGRADITFLDNKKYLPQLEATAACACLAHPAMWPRVPMGTAALLTNFPYHGFAKAVALFYPDAMRPLISQPGAPPVHPTARLEEGVELEPGAVVGREAHIGRGTRIASGAVIGARCTVGRDSYVGALATISHSLIGDRVIIHAGARLGQDGFGFAIGKDGHLKVPQIGRVIVQDDVEIGANTTIDRGVLKDTVIGEGTKIDNLVQIGHNVVIGRHCLIVAHVGIAGSTELGDFVVMGGQSGAVGHIKIGTRAMVAGAAHPTADVAPGARVGGTPARPMRQWGREIAVLARLAKGGHKGSDADSGE